MMKTILPPRALNVYQRCVSRTPSIVSPSAALSISTSIAREADSSKKNALLREQACVLREDLLVRMAGTLRVLSSIREADIGDVGHTIALQDLIHSHAEWFVAVADAAPHVDTHSYDAFMRTIKEIRDAPNEHILLSMATIGRRDSHHHRRHAADGAFVQTALKSLCRRRMMWRLLIANHLALSPSPLSSSTPQSTLPRSCSVFNADLQIEDIVKSCIAPVAAQCFDTFTCCPSFVVESLPPKSPPCDAVADSDAAHFGVSRVGLCHVEATLRYVFCELLKNAARATTRRHQSSLDKKTCSIPPIRIQIDTVPDAVRVVIADEGGGLAAESEKRAWDFGFSTASHPQQHGGAAVPLAGFGLGLPLSRLFAEQFGGSLRLSSSSEGCAAEFVHPLVGSEVSEGECGFLES